MLETSSACESEANETNTDLLGTGRRWPSGAGLWGQLCSLGCRGAAGTWPSTPHSTPHSSQQLPLRPGHTPSRQHDLEAANSAACAPARHPPPPGWVLTVFPVGLAQATAAQARGLVGGAPVVLAVDPTQSKAGSRRRVPGGAQGAATPPARAPCSSRPPLPPAGLHPPSSGRGGGAVSSSGSQVWPEGREGTGRKAGGGLCAPSPSRCSSPHRLPQPPRCHVREPVRSLVHGEAGGHAPRLHGHPGERPADAEHSGDPPQRPGLSIPSHHLRPGPALGGAGGPSGGQPGGPAQLAGR